MPRKETMDAYTKRRGNEIGMKVAKKEAGMAPPNTTGMGKGKKMKGMKNTPDAKGPSKGAWMKDAVRGSGGKGK